MNLVVIVSTASLVDYQAADVWKNFWGLQGGVENYTSLTGIEAVKTETPDKSNTLYDLQGRKLKSPQRGLNIINGKKIFVR